MILTMALALATVDGSVGQGGEAPTEASCPALTLSNMPGVRLVATELSAWVGPMLELQLASSEQEAASFGLLETIRLSGKLYIGGRLDRRVDDQGQFSFALAFEPEALAALAGATSLELSSRDGGTLRYQLMPAEAAALRLCMDGYASQSAPPGNPETRRNFTFLPIEPNQPLRLRYRGNPSSYYPVAALRENRHGTTRIAVTIGASGRVTECTIVASSGHVDLDQASCRAARTSAYLPETNAMGEPVAVKREQVIEWKVE